MKSKKSKKPAPTPPVNPLGVPTPADDTDEATLPTPRIDRYGRPVLPVGALALMLRRVAATMARRASTVDDAVRMVNFVADDLLAMHRAHEKKPPQQPE